MNDSPGFATWDVNSEPATKLKVFIKVYKTFPQVVFYLKLLNGGIDYRYYKLSHLPSGYRGGALGKRPNSHPSAPP